MKLPLGSFFHNFFPYNSGLVVGSTMVEREGQWLPCMGAPPWRKLADGRWTRPATIPARWSRPPCTRTTATRSAPACAFPPPSTLLPVSAAGTGLPTVPASLPCHGGARVGGGWQHESWKRQPSSCRLHTPLVARERQPLGEVEHARRCPAASPSVAPWAVVRRPTPATGSVAAQ
ncbi:hypothetical protein E2562_037715 [Oryza meyeriana var. granulata]|uniref:Uncharacterized protein n=1 Tax=Oryza meyeriana var. granulata TaxID=110450 RepID=A0A6G1DS41_9ORYZ|nr:hypothetical protein E2562_037715 [Oryza meyeriana var. granulata]